MKPGVWTPAPTFLNYLSSMRPAHLDNQVFPQTQTLSQGCAGLTFDSRVSTTPLPEKPSRTERVWGGRGLSFPRPCAVSPPVAVLFPHDGPCSELADSHCGTQMSASGCHAGEDRKPANGATFLLASTGVPQLKQGCDRRQMEPLPRKLSSERFDPHLSGRDPESEKNGLLFFIFFQEGSQTQSWRGLSFF